LSAGASTTRAASLPSGVGEVSCIYLGP
jgi:hypothetical protein